MKDANDSFSETASIVLDNGAILGSLSVLHSFVTFVDVLPRPLRN